MADWKTYAKAARNTARKQAPEVTRSAQESVRRGSQRAGDYVRAAGRAVEETRRDDDPEDDLPRDSGLRPEPEEAREYDPRPGSDSPAAQDGRLDQDPRPAVDTDRLRRGAAAYYTVAERRVRRAQLGPRIMRAVRDALLIGLSIFAIWVVLAAAGLQIPLSAVLIAVGVIVLISFGTSLYASSKRAREPDHSADDGGGDTA